jgi:type II secretory pathway component PulM
MTLNERFQALRDKWERLSQRERTMVGALGVTFVVMVTLIVGFLISDGLSTMDERNRDMRQALRELETQRDAYLRNKAKAAQLEVRLGQTPVQLQGYLEAASKDAGVAISETNERPPVAVNKFFTEHAVDLQMHGITLEQLTKFLKAVETGRNLVVVTKLNVRTRDDKHQQLDADISVSTYERQTAKPAAKKGDQG